jgi:hypothetical protein
MHSGSLESVASVVREAKEIVVFSGRRSVRRQWHSNLSATAQPDLWNNVDPDEVASIEGFLRNRVWSGTGCCN